MEKKQTGITQIDGFSRPGDGWPRSLWARIYHHDEQQGAFGAVIMAQQEILSDRICNTVSWALRHSPTWDLPELLGELWVLIFWKMGAEEYYLIIFESLFLTRKETAKEYRSMLQLTPMYWTFLHKYKFKLFLIIGYFQHASLSQNSWALGTVSLQIIALENWLSIIHTRPPLFRKDLPCQIWLLK